MVATDHAIGILPAFSQATRTPVWTDRTRRWSRPLGPPRASATAPWSPWTTPSTTLLRVPAGEPDTYGQAGHVDEAVHRPAKIVSTGSMVAMDHAIGILPAFSRANRTRMDRPDTSMEPSTGPAKIVSTGSMVAMCHAIGPLLESTRTSRTRMDGRTHR